MKKVQNLKSYAVDDIAPGDTADREESVDLDRQLEAGTLAEVSDVPKDAIAADVPEETAKSKQHRTRKTSEVEA